MFEWEIVVRSSSTGHETIVEEWTTERMPSDRELKARCMSYSGGDSVATLMAGYPGNGYVKEPCIETGTLRALGPPRRGWSLF